MIDTEGLPEPIEVAVRRAARRIRPRVVRSPAIAGPNTIVLLNDLGLPGAYPPEWETMDASDKAIWGIEAGWTLVVGEAFAAELDRLGIPHE